MKRLISFLIVSCMLVSMLPISALAQTYDLCDGSIIISTKESGGQYVSVDGGNEVEQTSTTIITSTGTTSHTITVSTEGETTADFTLEDVSISTSGETAIEIGDSSANITLVGDNEMSAEGAAGIHVSSGNVTISGDGSLSVKTNGKQAMIGSNENEDMSGSIHITGDAEVTANATTNNYYGGAAIGSGREGDLSGSITIDGNANVTASSDKRGTGIGSGYQGEMSGSITIEGDATVNASSSGGYGAGIGSGYKKDMSGIITIGGDANVTASSDGNGAGIGSGQKGEMSGNITIGGDADVTAWTKFNGAGIGSGWEGDLSGSITIEGNTNVTSFSGSHGAGIGSGQNGDLSGSITIKGDSEVITSSSMSGSGIGAGCDGQIAEEGTITIGGSTHVTTIGGLGGGTGIGAGRDEPMKGTIVIGEKSKVLAISGGASAAIGSEDAGAMEGAIAILGNSEVTTGAHKGVTFGSDTKTITYTPLKSIYGYFIGDSASNRHDNKYGAYLIGPDVTINGISGSDLEGLKLYVNVHLDEDGNMENLALLQTSQTDGTFSAEILNDIGEAVILYDGQAEMPTKPGSYKVSCRVKVNDVEINLPLGTLVVPEPEPEPELEQPTDSDQPANPDQPTNSEQPAEPNPIADEVNAPLYRVTDETDQGISYLAQQNDTVLTVTAHAEAAVLTGSLSAMTVLHQQGVETIRFVTNGTVSTFQLNDLLAHGGGDQVFELFHRGNTAEMTLDGVILHAVLLAE